MDEFPDGWTVDHRGVPVRWDRPPHLVRGHLNFALEGERFIEPEILDKRIQEFYALTGPKRGG